MYHAVHLSFICQSSSMKGTASPIWIVVSLVHWPVIFDKNDTYQIRLFLSVKFSICWKYHHFVVELLFASNHDSRVVVSPLQTSLRRKWVIRWSWPIVSGSQLQNHQRLFNRNRRVFMGSAAGSKRPAAAALPRSMVLWHHRVICQRAPRSAKQQWSGPTNSRALHGPAWLVGSKVKPNAINRPFGGGWKKTPFMVILGMIYTVNGFSTFLSGSILIVKNGIS